MGNTASSCIVFNAALYAIEVELFSADDAVGAFLKQRNILLPGQSVKIKMKKAASIRLSGNGRTQDMIRILPSQIMRVTGIRDNSGQPSASHELSDQRVRPEPPVAPAIEGGNEKTQPRFQQRPPSWLDDRQSYGKDELQQLVRKLEIEALQKGRKENVVRSDDSIRAVRAGC